ncbi:SIR2 family protein [uncultured Roseobacter sp.]|uniref:SIR2 family protein n=1 Tax=uncultured Roseobacter sp. TaxID=114847 RepID=UPI002631F5F1|nr:SIR2 family protein [uncultured Roseobacter sp.]
MFTYNALPISTLRTSEDIERFGHQSLIRALNIGRVVAFVGSGTSLKFGHPTWRATAEQAWEQFDSLSKLVEACVELNGSDLKTDYDLALKTLENEIKRLKNGSPLPDNHFVELCEDYCAEAATLLERYPSELSAAMDKLKQYAPINQFRKGFATQFGLFHDEKPDELRKSTQFVKLVECFELSIGAVSLAEELDKFGENISNIDSSRALRTKLGIRRFLTLNYDLELEQMLMEEGRATPLDVHDAFKSFLKSKGQEQGGLDRGRAVTLKSPSGRVLRSTSSRANTLADLFSFGAFPTNYDASVHHLHGRIDDPDNMIITPKDYQRVYYGISAQKKSFDEARHAVFTGSDLFVLGMGSSERDVLEPLRDFLELETERRDAHGKVYYITASEFSGDGTLGEAKKKSETDAIAKTHELYKEYGMHTLYVDQSISRDVKPECAAARRNIFEARAEIAHMKASLTGGKSYNEMNVQQPCAELKLARAVMVSHQMQSGHQTEQRINAAKELLLALDSRLRDRALVEYINYVKSQRQDWWNAWSELPGLRLAVFGPHFYKCVDHKTQKLIVKEDQDQFPLIWRQTNLATKISGRRMVLGDSDKTPQLTGLLNATAAARKAAREQRDEILKINPDAKMPKERPASVARVSVPPGGGKGRMLSFFTNKQALGMGKAKDVYPFQALFNEFMCDGTAIQPSKWMSADEPYRACFAAHLTFAVEFSSCMIGFARLLQQLFPVLQEEWECTLEAEVKNGTADPERMDAVEAIRRRWDDLRNFQFHRARNVDPSIKTLKCMFDLLKECCPEQGWENRMIGFFSYVDRLVDERGDAHSPIHRMFFRMISGWGDDGTHFALPIDIVLVNSRADRPIRYLSKEEGYSETESRRDPQPDELPWQIRKDRMIKQQHWVELPRVRSKVIFREALEHAAATAPKSNGMAQLNAKEASEQAAQIARYLDLQNDDYGVIKLPEGLGNFLYRRVANGHFMAGLANAIYNQTLDAGEDHEEQFFALWKEAISALDIAYTRDKTRGFVDELLGVYRRLDRPSKPSGNIDESSRRTSSESEQAMERLRALIIDHMALLNYPTSINTLAACPDIAKVLRMIGGDGTTYIVKEINNLVGRGLASRYYKFSVRVNFRGDEKTLRGPEHFVYSLDTKVASAMRTRAGLEVYSNYRLVAFQPSLFPSQPERSLKPDIGHFERVSGIVRALVKTSHAQLIQFSETARENPQQTFDDAEALAARMEDYNDKLRAAYALVRGTFSISVIARLAEHQTGSNLVPFDEYRTWTRKLLNTATLLGQISKDYRKWAADERKDIEQHQQAVPFNQPFLRDEVSWLFNERALVSFVQGRLFDALPLFEQSRAMLGTSIERSDPVSYGATHRRVLMNFALAQMERGNISAAQKTLEQISIETQPLWKCDTPSVVHCMAEGYLALCYHLTNDFPRAEAGYKKVIEEIAQFDHPRADSIFRRHYGDLMRAMSKSRNDEQFKEAITLLRSSEELALGIRATDLQNYAMMAQARLNRDMDNRVKALERLREVEAFATRMGAQKMLAEVLKVRGEVLLAEGETAQAGNVTSQSIALSKRNGMKLRKVSAAIVQARILRERDQHQDARRLLNETIMEAQLLGYATKTAQAMREVERLK